MTGKNTDFLLKCLTGHPNPKTVLRDYESFDGYKVKNCPSRACEEGLYPNGSDAVIPVGVNYRILEIIQEMRKEGIREKEYYRTI